MLKAQREQGNRSCGDERLSPQRATPATGSGERDKADSYVKERAHHATCRPVTQALSCITLYDTINYHFNTWRVVKSIQVPEESQPFGGADQGGEERGEGRTFLRPCPDLFGLIAFYPQLKLRATFVTPRRGSCRTKCKPARMPVLILDELGRAYELTDETSVPQQDLEAIGFDALGLFA